MYSSYEISRHHESRHSILSSLFRRKNGVSMSLVSAAVLIVCRFHFFTLVGTALFTFLTFTKSLPAIEL